MKPKPFTRSLTFWSGILVMGFICWAWWDSMNSRMLAQVGQTRMFSAGGEIGFFLRPDGFGGYQKFMKKPGRFKVIDNIPAAMATVPLKTGEVRSLFKMPRMGRGQNTLYVPYWFFLIPVILPWSGLLFLRAGRIRRAVAECSG